MRLGALALCLAVLASHVASAWAEESTAAWPEFRGPSGQGVVAGPLPLHWSEKQGIVWKATLPGRGWSSPVIVGDRIWVTTAEEIQADEASRARLLEKVKDVPVAADMVAVATVTLSALEIELATGKLVRQVKLFEIDSPPPIHGLNSYASPSPVVVGRRIFCHFGAMGTACIDAQSGELLWRRRLAIEHIVGPGSSPVAYGQALIVPSDGSDRQFITALDLATGETVWERPRPPIRETDPDQRKAFCTPLIIDVHGQAQVVIPGAQWYIAYDPVSGDELWRIDHNSGFSNVPRPVYDGRQLYLCSGFGKRSLWAVCPDGVGDITATHVSWREDQQAPTMSSPVISEGRLYVVNEGGVASCLSADTGAVLWRKRLGGNYSASPLMADGRLYLFSQEGKTTVVADADEYQELAENLLDGMVMASPAATSGELIVRTDTHLYRIR